MVIFLIKLIFYLINNTCTFYFINFIIFINYIPNLRYIKLYCKINVDDSLINRMNKVERIN